MGEPMPAVRLGKNHLRWCDECNLPVLESMECPLCGRPTREVEITPPIENFPTADARADTCRLNAELEAWIRKHPDQYLWVHRRFKTRPEGEPSVY